MVGESQLVYIKKKEYQGALTDFGCYGANIATWMLKGQVCPGYTVTNFHTAPSQRSNIHPVGFLIKS